MSKKRNCPITGCTVQIGVHLVMCPHHWSYEDPVLKSQVWRWYRTNPTLHRKAVADVIASVIKAERDEAAAGIQQPLL